MYSTRTPISQNINKMSNFMTDSHNDMSIEKDKAHEFRNIF
jgi:hypothetical protein